MPPPLFRLKSRLAGGAAANPHDAIMARKALLDVGFPAATNFGSTKVTDTALDHSVRRFQMAKGLKSDGVINPGGETESALSQILAVRPELRRPIPSSSRKTILTGREPAPTVTPRTPPGKPNTGIRINPTAGMPKQGQARPNPIAQPLRQAIEVAVASNEVYSDNRRAAKAAVKTTDHNELAWLHSLAIRDDRVAAMGELVDFGQQLLAIDEKAYESWIAALARQKPAAAKDIGSAVHVRTNELLAAEAKGSQEEAQDNRQAANTADKTGGRPDGLDRGAGGGGGGPSNKKDSAVPTDTAGNASGVEDGEEGLQELFEQLQNVAEGINRRLGPDRSTGGTHPNSILARMIEIPAYSLTNLPEAERETFDDPLDLVREGLDMGLVWAPVALWNYLFGNGKTFTVPAHIARNAPGVSTALRGSQKHFEDWTGGVEGSEAEEDKSGFGKVLEWINSQKQEAEKNLENMTWTATGGSSFLYFPTDSNLNFGGVKVVGKITKGKLIRNDNGTVTIDAIVEFYVVDIYNFTKEPDPKNKNAKKPEPSNTPLAAGLANWRWITPAHTVALEDAGGAKQFDVTSETWTQHLSGTIWINDQTISHTRFSWNDMP